MSYCRWSSDGFRSDVYVYDATGWITMVAGNRIANIEDAPHVTANAEDVGEWMAQRQAFMKWLENHAEHILIGLPHDGEVFTDPTPGACADRLESLRAMGYHVPQHAIDTLREEQAREAEKP